MDIPKGQCNLANITAHNLYLSQHWALFWWGGGGNLEDVLFLNTLALKNHPHSNHCKPLK